MSEPIPDTEDRWPDDPADSDSLTAPQIRFVHAVFDGKSLTDAYLSAGFPPVAHASAQQLAWRMSRKPHVVAYMRKVRDQAMLAAQQTSNAIVAGIAAIAHADRAALFDGRGRLLPPDQWPPDVRAAVEGVESEELYEPVPGQPGKRRLKGYARKVKTGSRIAAFRLLAEIKEMVGQARDRDAGKPPPAPLVVEEGPEHVPPPTDEPGDSDGRG